MSCAPANTTTPPRDKPTLTRSRTRPLPGANQRLASPQIRAASKLARAAIIRFSRSQPQNIRITTRIPLTLPA